MFYIEPNLKLYEQKVYSQFGEDGVIEKLAECLGLVSGSFFEFGIGPAWQHPIEDGLEGNFVLLREKGWKGTFLDGGVYPPEYNVRQEFVTALNINLLYEKHCLPLNLDFMSIDVDGQELWIWLALTHRPKLIITEYNGGLGEIDSVSVQFDVNHRWDLTRYHGASLKALDKVGTSKNYTLVYANGVNAFFVQNELISNRGDFSFERLFTGCASHAVDPLNRPWIAI